MHPAFATIKFGPFKSEYHQAATADENFREALSDYLVAALLPQVDQSFDGSSGTLCATYDDQKYCGPNSAVRDLYTLEFAFHRVSGEDSIKAKLAYSPKERSFSVARRGLPLYL